MNQAKSLIINFNIKLFELQRICAQQDLDIQIYCVLRSCEEQAKVFRETRSKQEIKQKMQSYKDRDLEFLSDVLDSVGPQHSPAGSPHKTKAGPGESWHQYLLAADSVPISNGKAIWHDQAPEWEIYGAVANYLDLHWGGDWEGFKDLPHVQAVHTSNPLTQFKDPEIVREILVEAKSL